MDAADNPELKPSIEKELPKPSVITVYAVEITETEEIHASPQGFLYGNKLETPRMRVFYEWNGRVFHNYSTGHDPDENWTLSRNSRKDVSSLAENLALNLRESSNPQLLKKGKPSYSINLHPTEEQIEQLLSESAVADTAYRRLTPEEIKNFTAEFQRAWNDPDLGKGDNLGALRQFIEPEPDDPNKKLNDYFGNK